jgi:hypothetical protein
VLSYEAVIDTRSLLHKLQKGCDIEITE